MNTLAKKIKIKFKQLNFSEFSIFIKPDQLDINVEKSQFILKKYKVKRSIHYILYGNTMAEPSHSMIVFMIVCQFIPNLLIGHDFYIDIKTREIKYLEFIKPENVKVYKTLVSVELNPNDTWM